MVRNVSLFLTKPQKSHFSFKSFGKGLFGFKNVLKPEEEKKREEGKKKEIYLKIKKNDSFIFKGIIPKKPQNKLVKQKSNSFYYEITKKKLLFKKLISTNALSYQYNKTLLKNMYEINKNISFNLENENTNKLIMPLSPQNSDLKNEVKENNENGKSDPSPGTSQSINVGENLQKTIDELNNIINSKDEEIKKIEKEKADIILANQLFTDSSNEQIENLSDEIKTYKENNEKLLTENKTLKEEFEEKKEELNSKVKQFDEDKNNLNKTIEELTKDNRGLKLDLFKKNSELEELKNSLNKKENKSENKNEEKKEENNNKNNETNSSENKNEIETLKEEIKKLKQSKIIEASQLKLEATKYKVEIKRLTNQIENLKKEKLESDKANEENINTLKINDIINVNNNDITDLKNKNKDYEIQIKKMKSEIEEYKKKVNNGEGVVDIKKYEELKNQNLLYYNKVQEAQKKIIQANALVGKAKKYNICVAYLSQLLGLIKPENEKQTYLFNKLKSFSEEYEKEKNAKK